MTRTVPVKTPWIAIVGAVAMMLSVGAKAQTVPVALQAAIFAKVLSYDQALPKRKGSAIVFHIVLDGKTSGQASQLKAGFAPLAKTTIAGRKVQLEMTPVAKVKVALARKGVVHLVYLPGDSAASTVRTAVAAASAATVPVLGGNDTIVRSGGALGLAVVGGKPKIIVHLKNSIAQGMKLSASILKLATVI